MLALERSNSGPVAPDSAKIRRLRYARGLTQEHLAKAADLGKKTIEHIESGQSVRPATLRRIADALGVQISELLFEEVATTVEARLTRMEKQLQAFENYIRAEGLRLAGGFEAAKFFYESVIELVEGEELAQNALIGIGKIHRQRREWKQAIAALTKVLEQPDLGVSHARAHYNMACYLYLSGEDKRKVLIELGNALSKAPAPTFYGEYAMTDKDFEGLRADIDFQKVIQESVASHGKTK